MDPPTQRLESLFWPDLSDFPLPYLKEAPYVPTALPTVGSYVGGMSHDLGMPTLPRSGAGVRLLAKSLMLPSSKRMGLHCPAFPQHTKQTPLNQTRNFIPEHNIICCVS